MIGVSARRKLCGSGSAGTGECGSYGYRVECEICLVVNWMVIQTIILLFHSPVNKLIPDFGFPTPMEQGPSSTVPRYVQLPPASRLRYFKGHLRRRKLVLETTRHVAHTCRVVV